MFDKARKARDAFAFSLGGMTAVAPFFPAQAIADDRINRIRDEQVRRELNLRESQSPGRPDNRLQPAQDCA